MLKTISAFIFSLMFCSAALSAERAVLQDGNGTELGSSANPVHVTGISGSQWTTQNVNDVSLAGGNVGVGTVNTTTAALAVFGGNVGIGTWIPANLLHVGNGTGFQVTSSGGIAAISGSTSATLVATALNLAAGGISATIKNNNSSSGAAVTVIGSSATNGFVELRSTSGTGSGDLVKISGGTNGGTTVANFFGTGNVGIGSATPGSTLDVQTGTNGFRVFGTSSKWTKKTGANTACDTTCGTSQCAFGEDTGVLGTLLACSDATADVCICMGP